MDHYTREQFAEKLGAAERGDPKLNAAADFAARLLNGPEGDKIARIVLFGSVAGGEAGLNSDVDVMVFANASPERLSRAVGDAAFEATVEWAEAVAPLTYALGRLIYPRPYVVYDTLQRGREIFAMDETELRRQEAGALYRKAKRHYREAQTATEQGLYTLAIVGAYAAAELAAKALILLKPGVGLPHTHGGTVQIFSRDYIRTGEAPENWADELDAKLRLRSTSLYDADMDPSDDDARGVLDLARDMLAFFERKSEEIQSERSD